MRPARPIIVAICAGAGLFLAAPAAAQSTHASDMAVGASVVGECTVSVTELNFGDAINPVLVTEIDMNGTVTVSCSDKAIFSMEMDYGTHANGTQRRLRNAAGDYLNYQIYRNFNRTQVWAVKPTEKRNGIILNGGGSEDYEAYGTLTGITPSTPTGTYTDTITVTLTF